MTGLTPPSTTQDKECTPRTLTGKSSDASPKNPEPEVAVSAGLTSISISSSFSISLSGVGCSSSPATTSSAKKTSGSASASQAHQKATPTSTPRKKFTAPAPRHCIPSSELSRMKEMFPSPLAFIDVRGRSTKKYFVVVKGRRVGIFSEWLDANIYVSDCKKNASYQGFESFEAAYAMYEKYYAGGLLQVIRGFGLEQSIVTQPPPLPVFDVSSDEEEHGEEVHGAGSVEDTLSYVTDHFRATTLAAD
ncbi:hypothetical protein H0H92_004580 [Tricholoma furcatifolium]|nr:hypothetical protein H0H92_004580 [Tricholoma furcatifolium]